MRAIVTVGEKNISWMPAKIGTAKLGLSKDEETKSPGVGRAMHWSVFCSTSATPLRPYRFNGEQNLTLTGFCSYADCKTLLTSVEGHQTYRVWEDFSWGRQSRGQNEGGCTPRLVIFGSSSLAISHSRLQASSHLNKWPNSLLLGQVFPLPNPSMGCIHVDWQHHLEHCHFWTHGSQKLPNFNPD